MESQEPAESVKPMPFIDKLTNIFASPGELFENVRETGPTNSNWLVPWMIYVAISIATGQFVLSNASLSSQLERTVRDQFEKSMEQGIREGSVTREQADQQFEQFAKPGSTWFTLLSTGGTLLGSLAFLFGDSLFFLLVSAVIPSKSPTPILKDFLFEVSGNTFTITATNLLGKLASASYMKVVEVIGLTFLIGSLERVVTTALMFATDSINTSTSLALLLSKVDLENKLHVAFSKLDVFTFWEIVVTSIGLSAIFQKDFPKVLVLVIALWILWTLLSILIGLNIAG